MTQGPKTLGGAKSEWSAAVPMPFRSGNGNPAKSREKKTESGRDYLLTLTAVREREVLLRLGLFRSLNTFQLERFLPSESALTAESRRVITKRILGSLRKRGLL